MDLEALKEMFAGGGDMEAILEKIIPKLDTVLGWIQLVVRICVMAGPVILLAFGLVYLVLPPKEANHSAGFRCWWGMSSLDAWRFTQRTAGVIWSALGMALTVMAAASTLKYVDMPPMEMAWSAVESLVWQGGLTLISCVVIHLIVFIFFNHRGFRRFGNKE